MEDPRQKFSTGTQMSVQGHELLHKDGGARQKSHVTSKASKVLRISTYDPLLPRIRSSTERDNNGTLNCQYGDHLDELSESVLQAERISVIQDGDFLIPSPSVCTSNSECDSVKFDAAVPEYDDKKVDEWLKRRSDSLSSIVLEMKSSSDDYLCGIEIDRLSEVASEKDVNPVPEFISNNYSAIDNISADLADQRNDSEVGLVDSNLQNGINSLSSGGSAVVLEEAGSLGLAISGSHLELNEHQSDQRSGLNELESSSHLDHDDDLLEQSKKALQSLPTSTFRSCETSLLTLQELEHLPKTGLSLEFETELDPCDKEKEIVSETQMVPQSLLNENQASNPVEIAIPPSSEDNQNGQSTVIGTEGENRLDNKQNVENASVPANKDGNTIQILINTEQGGQVVQLCDPNASSLQQALESLLSQASVLKFTLAVPDNVANSLDIAGIVPNDGGNDSVNLVSNNDTSNSNSTNTTIETKKLNVNKEGTKNKDGTVAENDPCVVLRLCPYESCNRTFPLTESKKFKSHILNHSERVFRCTVEGCEWSFMTENRLRRHMESHIGKKDYVCDVEGCNKRFTTVYNLKTHKNLHKRANSIPCLSKTCSLTFPTKRLMELHLRVHQEVPAPYKCPFPGCGKECYSSNSLSSHLRVHKHSENDLKCPFEGCEKIFDKVCRLKEHIRQHTGERPYVCEFEGCHWSFISASKLTRHMRKHTGERKFPCPEPGCGKSFLRPEHLEGHIIVHSGRRPFKCPHENCSSRFTAKSSLYIHLKKHKNTEKLVYPCPIESCNKEYSFKASLRIHLRKFHSTSLEPSNIVTLLSNEELQEIATMDGWVPEFAAVSVAGENAQNAVIAEDGSTILGQQLILPETYVMQEFALASISQDYRQNELSQQLTATPNVNAYKTDANASTTVLVSDAVEASDVESSHQESGLTLTPEDLELLTSPCILQENNSGSARTDYCSNYSISSRAKRRRLLQLQQERAKLNISIKDTSKDVQLIPESPFQDDIPLLSGEIYQDEVFTAIQNPHLSTELNGAASLLENSSDFGSPAVNMNSFPLAIGLRDLE